MNIEEIFSTEERIRILKDVIFRTDATNVNSKAARLRLSKGLVSKYFDILAREKVLKKTSAFTTNIS